MNPRRWSPATWVFIGWNVIFAVILSQLGSSPSMQGNASALVYGTIGMVAFWLVGDVVIGIFWVLGRER